MIKYEKLEDGSYLHNCLLDIREDDRNRSGIFHQEGDKSMSARLNGYAIIPMEEYCKLKDIPFNNKAEILEADRQLHGRE